MAARVHRVEQYKSAVPGIEAMSFASNHHFPRHSHDHFGIGVIAFGAQRSWSGVGLVESFAGDVIMSNPGEMHDGSPVGGKPRGWQMIYLNPASVAGALQDEIEGPVEFVRPVARDPRLARHVSRVFASLTTSWPDGLASDEQLCRTLIYAMRPRRAPQRAASGPSPSVARALDRLDSAPQTPVSLGELAALAGVSRFQLLRGFAREVGITPHAYLVQRRVRFARQLLVDGHTPVEAAMRAGFADQSHMTRAFVRQVGITPARYRAAIA